MAYRLYLSADQTVLAEGSTVLVTFDYHSGATIPIPQRWRQVIQRFEGLPER